MILDNYDKNIIKELIINPKLNDNKISQITKIPVKTVNRKRNNLEKNGIIKYFVSVNNQSLGTEDFDAEIMYIIKLKHGIYRKQFIDTYLAGKRNYQDFKHIKSIQIAENNGHLVLIMHIESRTFSDILEIFNVEVIKRINNAFGPNSIIETQTYQINSNLHIHHNYELLNNMESGKLKSDWNKELIFVSDK